MKDELEMVGKVLDNHGRQIDLLQQQVEIRDRIPLTEPMDIVGVVNTLWKQVNHLMDGEQVTASAMASIELSLAKIAMKLSYLEAELAGMRERAEALANGESTR